MRRWWLGLDVAAVVIFVAIGRHAHHQSGGLGGVATTAWPFLVGVAIGWSVPATRRAPTRLVPAGIIVWVATVAGGTVLRQLSGQGVEALFVVVASVFLGLFLLLPRTLALLAGRRRGRLTRRHRAVADRR